MIRFGVWPWTGGVDTPVSVTRLKATRADDTMKRRMISWGYLPAACCQTINPIPLRVFFGKLNQGVHDCGRYEALTGMNDIEPTVIRRVLAGDRDAFAIVVRARWAPLVALARSVLGDVEAEDAVQDGLVTAWRRRSSLRDEAAFPAWLTRVVMRTCFRRARNRPTLVPLALVTDHADRPRDLDAGLDVQRYLAALAPRQRAVMHLTVIEGMSDREIGHTLDLSAGSVRAHRRRARARLARLLDVASPEGRTA